MEFEQLEETFGPEVVASVKRNAVEPWGIESALQRDWNSFETNPPDSLDKQDWARKLPVTPGSTYSLIVDNTQDRYNTYSQTGTIKRLARYGLPVLLEGWEEQIADAGQYRQAAGKLAEYLEGNPDQYSLTKEKQQLNIDDGKSSGKQEQWRVIWYQKLLIARIADELGLTEADVLRRIILEGGKALGETGTIKENQHDNIIRIADEIDNEVNKRVKNLKRPVRGILFEALLTDYRMDVAELCQNEFPRVWNEFEEVAQAANNPETSGFLEDVDI